MTTIRADFHARLSTLQDDLVVLGSMAEKAVLRAMDALHTRDVAVAAGIMHDDNAIDEKRFAVEDVALELMATQQPAAGDLRVLAAVLNLASELERIGDHAEGIAKIVVMLGDEGAIRPVPELETMTDRAISMLHRSLTAFIGRDAETAKRICDEDDEVDALQDRIFERIVEEMRRDPSIITRATFLLWIAHNLERVADRATNICERVVFVSTGRMEELNVSVY